MSFQPAFDQINAEALRLGLSPLDGEITWEQIDQSRAVEITCTFPDGTTLKGYAPNGMDRMEPKAPTLALVTS